MSIKNLPVGSAAFTGTIPDSDSIIESDEIIQGTMAQCTAEQRYGWDNLGCEVPKLTDCLVQQEAHVQYDHIASSYGVYDAYRRAKRGEFVVQVIENIRGLSFPSEAL